MTDYVIVLCCDHFGSNNVIFVLKDRPEWQKGCLNLPGGKIEKDESPEDAAAREVLEETGYKPWLVPEVMGILKDGNDRIFCAKVVVDGNVLLSPREEETESVFWQLWHKAADDVRLIPNLRIIVPLMKCGVTGWEMESECHGSTGSMQAIKVHVPTLA